MAGSLNSFSGERASVQGVMMAEFATHASTRNRVSVWDPAVRIAHWLLVLAFAVAYLTAEEETDGPDLVHVWGGYVVGAIIAFRVIWGFVGPQHARFSDFVCGPAAALKYLADLMRGRAKRYLGHSPAGGVMVLALLVCLAGTVGTGLIAYGEQGKGPLAGMVTVAPGQSNSETLGEKQENEESLAGELHDTLANLTLVLVVFHVLGIALASYVHRENLVSAMINGRKRDKD